MGTLLPFRLLPGDEADLPKRRLKNPHRQAEESLNEIVSLLQSGFPAIKAQRRAGSCFFERGIRGNG